MCRPPKKPKIEQILDIIEDKFSKFKDPRKGAIEIELSDFLKSTYSVFALKHPSLLDFEKTYKKHELIHNNVKKLFRIERLPSDTHLRDILDLVDYKQYRKVFTGIFAYVQKTKLLEQFSFIEINDNHYYLLAVDGTGYFSSPTIQCKGCTVYNEDDDSKEKRFGHQVLAASIVHPYRKEVISLCPEPIIKQDGLDKNDCEYNAFKRFLADFRREHPKLRVILLLDGLYANTPFVELLNEYDMPFIISVKTTKKALFRHFKEEQKAGLTHVSHDHINFGEKIKKLKTRRYEYTKELKLGQDKDSAKVNFINFMEKTEWVNRKGENKKEGTEFSYITNLAISKDSVKLLVQGGRTRWKIENETFNTLKNQGYFLEHNYGHGKANLSLNFINSMFLAFLVDQIQQATSVRFKKAVESRGSKMSFWRSFLSCFEWVEIESWEYFFEKMVPTTNTS